MKSKQLHFNLLSSPTALDDRKTTDSSQAFKTVFEENDLFFPSVNSIAKDDIDPLGPGRVGPKVRIFI